jgi:hypothetical protein
MEVVAGHGHEHNCGGCVGHSRRTELTGGCVTVLVWWCDPQSPVLPAGCPDLPCQHGDCAFVAAGESVQPIADDGFVVRTWLAGSFFAMQGASALEATRTQCGGFNTGQSASGLRRHLVLSVLTL